MMSRLRVSCRTFPSLLARRVQRLPPRTMEPRAAAGGDDGWRRWPGSSGHGSEVHLRYFERSQHDIIPERHADMGSSCCALFASAVVAGAMQDAKRLSPERLEALLAQCVRAWDATREVAGGDVEQVLRAVLEDSGIEAKVSGFAMTPEMLFKFWSSSSPPRVCLLTAIPRETVNIRPTGNTFAVCHLQDGVHLIDSHRHHTERGCLGMLWARASSLSVLHGWLFNSSGLLEQLHCRTDFLEVVAVAEGGRPAPAAAALGPAGEESGEESDDVVLMEPPVAAVARGAALAAEAARLFPPCRNHLNFEVQCDRCRWRKHGARFADLSAYIDAVTFCRQAALAVKPSASPAEFAIGCTLCARHVALSGRIPSSKWSRFEILGAGVSLDSIRKHLSTDAHQAALRSHAAAPSEPLQEKLRGDSPHQKRRRPELPASDNNGGLVGAVPRQKKFADAIRGCLRGDSGHAFSLAQPSAPQGDLVSAGVFRDESRKAHRKMLVAAAAVLDEKQRAMLQNAVRIAFADDDRDQHRILRIRVVWERPTVGCAEFFGALLKDYGFDAPSCCAANVEGFKRLCSERVRVPPREGGGILAEKDQVSDKLDEPLWDHVRRTVFCGATDGAAVALLSVRQMAADPTLMPNLRYQFRDKPHTTRTCIKLVYNLCPESEELRTRLITGEKSFARRAKNSRRFQQLWRQKQLDEPDALWDVLTDLGYAEHRFDSRSKPMARFLLKLGPALEVLQVLSCDLNPAHRKDIKWARDLLQLLAGPVGFVKLVLFAIDTDFAVAAHKLIRLQDQVAPDVSVAAHEVQHCDDTCRMLFRDGRVFDRAPNGTYTNHLLQGFYGVSRELVLCDREQRTVKFGWPAATEDGLLKDAVAYAKKLYKAVNLCFQYNFPQHAWRTRFQAFCLSSHITHATRLEHIHALAAKEGVDPARAWTQFFEAFPHATRYHKECGDTRQAWISYLEACCRKTRYPKDWRPEADCIVPLVLTFLGIMDGSSDIERNFSMLELVECRRAKRHHSEQFLQDMLKVRLEAPEEFRKPQLGTGCEQAGLQFLLAAQRQYAKFFGTRRLASRSMNPVSPDEQRQLLASCRPRVQHARQRSTRGCAARIAEWESSVQMMLSDSANGIPRRASFVTATPADIAEEVLILAKAAATFGERSAAHEARQMQVERADRFAVVGPPPALKLSSLLEVQPKKKRKTSGVVAKAGTGAPASSSSMPLADAVQQKKKKKKTPQLSWADACLSPALRVYCSAAARKKHWHAWLNLCRHGCATPKPAGASHRVYAGKEEGKSIAKEGGGSWCSMSELLRELCAPVVEKKQIV